MSLILNLDLDVMKMYLRTKNEVCTRQGIQKLEANRTHRHVFAPVTLNLIWWPWYMNWI